VGRNNLSALGSEKNKGRGSTGGKWWSLKGEQNEFSGRKVRGEGSSKRSPSPRIVKKKE